ncbi:MAG: phosphoribosylformylglycinamidine cyclo-ligase [Tissierellia bacterium]|nr:phosphoribosylformylglycinamidine cyclo-ligase [Tissierellia bacterium]
MSLNYKDAGVDKEAGYKEVQLIKGFVERTKTPGVLSNLGGFSGLFQLDMKNLQEPVLVSGTDGVGTKLKLAFMMDKHNTIGEDCVAMCANDIICQGAKPLFFLDYIATGKLVPEKMAEVVEGIAEGCLKAGCALIGGETAEMPGFYNEDEYDVAGFCVGVVDKSKIITGNNIKAGDVIMGIPSSGVHSNGFSLIRKIVFDKMGFSVDKYIEELGKTLGEELLTPTRIYVKEILDLLMKVEIKSISHITGGGFYENIPRMLTNDTRANIDVNKIKTPEIFNLLMKWGNVSIEEMYSTFNMGIGMVLIVSGEDVDKVLKNNDDIILLGTVEEGEKGVDLCLEKK